MKARIRLISVSDCLKFTNLLEQVEGNGEIILTDGKNFTVSAHSFIGVCYSMEWDKIYIDWNSLSIKSEKDLWFLLRDFIADDSEDSATIHE